MRYRLKKANYSSLSTSKHHRNNKIPILAITKENSPKVAVNKETLSPPAKTDGSGFPMASTESNAVIKPITDPKKPKTKPNKLASTVSLSIFSDCDLFFLRLMKPFIRRNTDNRRQIKIRDINNGPPSLKRSANWLEVIKTLDNTNSFIIDDIKLNILQNYNLKVFKIIIATNNQFSIRLNQMLKPWLIWSFVYKLLIQLKNIVLL